MEKTDLILQYSPWFIPLCLLAGVIYAGILYYHERHNDFSRPVRILLMATRFLLVSFTAFLLLSPLVKKQSHVSQKPVIVIAQDFSSSISLSDDSSYLQTGYLEQLEGVITSLQGEYRTDVLSFGEEVKQGLSKKYDDQYTDMGAVLTYINNTYENRNLGAVFVATDGIVNQGVDPYYLAREMTFPIHAVALGDTITTTDIRLAAVRNNDIAYKDNLFPVQVDVAASNASGQNARLNVYRNDKLAESRSFTIDSDSYTQSFDFEFEAKEKGMQEFRISVSGLEGEENLFNNSRRVFIEVLETKQRILILGRRPHPDMAAIGRAIGTNPNYETETAVLDEFNQKAHAFNLVIMHSLPEGNRSLKILEQLKSNNIPVWFITGHGSSYNYLNNYIKDIKIQAGGKPEDVKGVLNDKYTLFSIPEDEQGLLSTFPPLQSMFGKYSVPDESKILVYRRIGNVTTSAPLWAFSGADGQKTGITLGEGLWRWRLYNYVENNDHELVDELIRKSVKYLVASEDKSRFRVKASSRFSEFEDVVIDAELYNQSYEPVNEPEVNLLITNEEGREFPYVMSRKGEAYTLNAGQQKPGVYRYNATTQLGAETFDKSGKFVVEDVNLESMNTTANHHLLYRLANEHNGKVLNARQLDEIPQIVEESQMKPVVYNVKEYMEWIRIHWLLIILISLLTVEWIVRKVNGAL